jgi:hypothetical protein
MLVLEDGKEMSVHSCLLRLSSPMLNGALSLLPPDSVDGSAAERRLTLPGGLHDGRLLGAPDRVPQPPPPDPELSLVSTSAQP